MCSSDLEAAELRVATATYLGRHIMIGPLGGGPFWKQFQQCVTSKKVSIAGILQRVYEIHSVTPELLPLLRKGNAELVNLEPDEASLMLAENCTFGGSHQ